MHAGSAGHRAGQLDGIRALCVLAVLLSHTISESYRIGGYLFFEFGTYGVSMFFVLSGFLITDQLLGINAQRRDAGDGAAAPLGLFYARRMLRLFPAYYLAIGCGYLFDLPGIRDEFSWHAAQLSDIILAIDENAEAISTAGHFWSLTIEWQFYLIWPLLIFVLPRRILPSVIVAMLLFSVLGTWWSDYLDPVFVRTNILPSLGSLAIGAGLGYARRQGWAPRWLERAAWPAAGLFGLSLLAAATNHMGTAERLELPAKLAMDVLFAAIVYRASAGFRAPAGALLDWSPMRYMGRISYGIYVYHAFLLAGIDRVRQRLGHGELNWGIWLTLELVLVSTAVAALSWRFIEAPINDLRHRLVYRPGTVAGTDESPSAIAA